jgi:hypothetical protein
MVTLYAQREWTMPRVHIDRVMDEQAFHRGRCNPQEGGPKGLEIVAERVVAVTGEFQPLAFFPLHESAVPAAGSATVDECVGSSVADLRTPILRLGQRLRSSTEEAGRVASQLAEVERERDGLAAELAASRSECDEIRLAHSAAEHVAENARIDLERVRRQHDDAAVEMDRLIERVGVLEAHVDKMYASTSWRWSAPLRACSWLAQRMRSLGR